MSMNGRALRRLSSAICILITVAACRDTITPTSTERSFAPGLSRSSSAAPGRHVFVLNGNVPADFGARVAAIGGTVVSSMDSIGVVVTEGLSDADATALAGTNAVAPDYVAQWVRAEDMQVSSAATVSEPIAATSAKPLSAQFLAFQWNMFQIHAPEAWAKTTAGPSIRVAILDSGLDPYHLDQRGLIDAAASKAFVRSTNSPIDWVDDFGHGTLVGSIVTSNNIGVAGVAPNATLVAVKVIGANGAGSIGDVVAGIYYATTVAKVQVINMSLGDSLPKHTLGADTLVSAMRRAVNYAKSHGVLVVSAAGNDAGDLQRGHNFIVLPCEAGVQLCVGATGNGDTHASYSNYGTNAIDVVAPGGDGPLSAASVATWILGPCSSVVCGSIGGYVIGKGTSLSAPHVSGLAAYLDSQFGGTLSPSQLMTLIQQNADDVGKPGADPFFGKGRINVLNTITTTYP